MLDYAEYIKIFIGLLAIVNPFGAIPLFISMTADQNSDQRRKTINTVAFGVCVILLVSLFFGDLLLRFFRHYHRFVQGRRRHPGVADGHCHAARQNQPDPANR